MRKKRRLKKSVKRFLCIFLLITIFVITNGALSKYISNTNGSTSVDVAKFSFSLKKDSQTLSDDFEYNLAGNITGGNSLSESGLCPGKSGEINLIIDMSGTEVKSNYAIYMDKKQTIPTNLKFYSDSSYSTEINLGASSMISGTIDLSDINTPLTKKIYWKWVWDDTSNEKDYEGNEFLFDIRVVVSQSTSG